MSEIKLALTAEEWETFLNALDILLVASENEHWECWEGEPHPIDMINSLMARISALLPPEDPS